MLLLHQYQHRVLQLDHLSALHLCSLLVSSLLAVLLPGVSRRELWRC